MQIKGLPRKNEENHAWSINANHWLVWNAASAFLGLSACLRSFLPTLPYNTPLRHLSDLAIAFFSDTSPQNSSATLLYKTLLQYFSWTLLCINLLQHFSATLFSNMFSTVFLYTSLQPFFSSTSTPFFYTSLQHPSPTLLYKTLFQHLWMNFELPIWPDFVQLLGSKGIVSPFTGKVF